MSYFKTKLCVSRTVSVTVKGFTLIELLLVLVILATLSALIVPKFAGRSEQARLTAARTDISHLETVISAYEVDCGSYPESLKDLAKQPSDTDGWHGPYLKESSPKDPWGNAYVYKYPGSENTSSFDLLSYGPDKREGSDDDIGNWDNSDD